MMMNTQTFIASLGILAGTAFGQVSGTPLEYNLEAQVQTHFDRIFVDNKVSSALVVGDSVSFRPDSWQAYYQQEAWDYLGFAGDGYLSFSNGHNNQVTTPRDRSLLSMGWTGSGNPDDIVRAKVSGTRLNDVNGNPQPFGVFSPDGIYTRVRNDANVFGTAYAGADVILHYVGGPDTGTIEIYANDLLVDSFDTNSPTEVHGTRSLNLNVLRLDDTPFTYRIQSADSQWVHLNGMEYIGESATGYRQYRNSRGGAGPDDFVLSTNTVVSDQVASYNDVNLLIYVVDWTSDQANFEAQTQQMVSFLQSARPDMGIVLVTHHAFRSGIATEAQIFYDLAQQNGWGYMNLYDLHPGGFAELDGLGFLADSVHLTDAGGEWFGNYMFRRLLYAYDASDWNLSGNFDVFDTLDYLDDFDAGNFIADRDGNLVFDIFDVLDFLEDSE